jgi:hypothetical protein
LPSTTSFIAPAESWARWPRRWAAWTRWCSAVTALLREGLTRGERVADMYETRGELVAVEEALGRLRPGDLLYIQCDQVELCLGCVQNYLATHTPVVSPERVGSEARLIAAH